MEYDFVKSFETMESHFSENNFISLFSEIANTASPSQTCRFTRGPVIADLLAPFMVEGIELNPNFLGTGNTVLCSKTVKPSILFIAHLDQISYLIDRKVDSSIWHLIPFCKHLSEIEVPAKVIRFNPKTRVYEDVALGVLFSKKNESGLDPFLKLESGDLVSGDRVVYHHPLDIKNGMARGNIDNAAGVTASLIAAIALFKINPDLPIGFVFTDEEEGPAVDPAYFARGARRLLRQIQCPRLCVLVDGHGGQGEKDMGKGAFFTEKTSGGFALVTPPDLFIKFKNLAATMRAAGLNIFEDQGRVSRGDDVACLEVTSQVLSVGYPSINRHYDFGVPTVSISDLLHLSKVLFWMGISFGTENG